MQRWSCTSSGGSGWLKRASLSRKMRLEWEYGKSTEGSLSGIGICSLPGWRRTDELMIERQQGPRPLSLFEPPTLPLVSLNVET